MIERSRIWLNQLLAVLIGVTPVGTAMAQRAIPDDNLAYPVLIIFKDGTGSGFYLNGNNGMYLVTAKHVLFDPQKMTLRDAQVNLLSYPKDLKDAGRNLLTLDLAILNNAGDIKAHPSEDVAVIKIAVYPNGSPPKAEEASAPLSLSPGVTVKERTTSGLAGATLDTIKTFDHVLIGNSVLMLGYPTSLALFPNPKIDIQRPLLRSGIVAGENVAQHSIILDCPSYQGDSGSPILEVDTISPFEHRFQIIGVMSAFVPFEDTWVNQHFNYTNTTLQNSGYSIITPMDFVLDLIK